MRTKVQYHCTIINTYGTWELHNSITPINLSHTDVMTLQDEQPDSSSPYTAALETM
jgi:hypothetical protein